MDIKSFNEASTHEPILVESTFVGAVKVDGHGSTQLLTSAGTVFVDCDIKTALETLGWPVPVPSNVDVPHLAGFGNLGETLTCTKGNWKNTPTSYAFQWLRDGTEIGAGAVDSHTVIEADVGHSITCVVTATNRLGSAAAPPSNAVTAVDPVALAAAAAKPAAPKANK